MPRIFLKPNIRKHLINELVMKAGLAAPVVGESTGCAAEAYFILGSEPTKAVAVLKLLGHQRESTHIHLKGWVREVLVSWDAPQPEASSNLFVIDQPAES
jgi:hypothetical protein